MKFLRLERFSPNSEEEMQATIDVGLHLASLRQLDQYQAGEFKIHAELLVPDEGGSSARPAAWLPPWLGSERFSGFLTRSFEPNVMETQWVNGMIVFRFAVPCQNGELPSAVLKLRFLIHDLPPLLKKRYPLEPDNFSEVSVVKLRLSTPSRPISEFCDVLFNDLLCVNFSVSIFSSLVGFSSGTESPPAPPNAPNQSELFLHLATEAQTRPGFLEQWHSHFVPKLQASFSHFSHLFERIIEEARKAGDSEAQLQPLRARRTALVPPPRSFLAQLRKEREATERFNSPQEAMLSKFISPGSTNMPAVPSQASPIDSLFQANSPHIHAQTNLKTTSPVIAILPGGGPGLPGLVPLVPGGPGVPAFESPLNVMIPKFGHVSLDLVSALELEVWRWGELVRAMSNLFFEAFVQTARSSSMYLRRKFHFDQEKLLALVSYSEVETNMFWEEPKFNIATSFIALNRRKVQKDLAQKQRYKVKNLSFWENDQPEPVLFEQVFWAQGARKIDDPLIDRQLAIDIKDHIRASITPEAYGFDSKPSTQNRLSRVLSAKSVAPRPSQTRLLRQLAPGPVARHLIVLVHGLGGSELSMRNFKNQVVKIFPLSEVFTPRANNSHFPRLTLEVMARRLAAELLEFLQQFFPGGVNKISFIGHSLGGVVIRAALPFMPFIHRQLFTFLSLGTPHLGVASKRSGIVSLGIKLYKELGNMLILHELDLTDNLDPYACSLYQVSQLPQFGLFQNFVFVSSRQDGYAPLESAHILVTKKTQKIPETGELLLKMAQNIFSFVKPDRISRVTVDLRAEGNALDDLTGRTAHTEICQNPKVAQLILYRFTSFFN